MNENWSRPEGAELEENRRAIRGMWVVVWVVIPTLIFIFFFCLLTTVIWRLL